MLAYVFWHWPGLDHSEANYVRNLLAFQRALAAAPPDGFVRCYSLALRRAPWEERERRVFEDWYLVEDFAALGHLNAAAVEGARRGPHDQIAAMSRDGCGGVYRLACGEIGNLPPSLALWDAKPPGKPYSEYLACWKRRLDKSTGMLWQRQMVLGPAPEFCAQFVRDPGDAITGNQLELLE